MKLLLLTLLFAFSHTQAEVSEDPNDVKPLLPGMEMPEIKVKNQFGKDIHLSPDNLQKPFVLSFYRGGWCPYCNAQLAELRKAEKELVDLGYDVFFMSPDTPEHLVSTLKDEDLKKEIDYQLLSDSSMKVARDFGVAFKVDDATVEKYKKWNIDLEKSSGHTHHLLPVPALFLVSKEGVIQFMYANPDYRVRLAPEILLAAAKVTVEKQK
jgi:peroxiredoxin